MKINLIRVRSGAVKQRYTWLLLLVPVILLWLLVLLADFNGLYGQDSHAYLAYAESLRTHWMEKTPLQPFFWPVGYPGIGAALSLLGLSCLWALRLVSLLALIAALLVARQLIYDCWKKEGAGWLVLAAATQIYFVRAGFLVMSDMLCALLVLLTFYAYIHYRKAPKMKWLTLLVAAAVTAFFIRYASVVVTLWPALHVCWLLFRGWQSRLKWLLFTGLITASVAALLFNNQFLEELTYRASNWSFEHVIGRTLTDRDGSITHTVPNGLYVFGNFGHLGYLSCGVLLIPFWRKLDAFSRMLLVPTMIYLLFLAGLDMQNYRFLIIVHLPVVVALYPAFQAGWEWLRKLHIRVPFVLGVLVVNTGFGIYSFSKTWRVHTLEKQVARSVKDLHHGEPIYSFYIDQSFPSYGIRAEIRNFYLQEYTTFEPGSLVVFNEQQFAGQWEEHRVMRNWRRLNRQHQLQLLRKMNENWIIYRIR